MRKWILLLVMGVSFAFPVRSIAQTSVTIASIDINLWPEYDRAEMLVINYILLAPDTPLPATLDVRIPRAVGKPHVIAVGVSLDSVTDQGVNFTSRNEGDWVIVSIQATGPAIQLEYYDPGLKKDGTSRFYAYKWLSDYEVQYLSFTVQQPVDASDFKVTPALQDDGVHQDKLQYFVSEPVPVPPGEMLSLDLNYEKSSDTLSATKLQIQPVGVDENTPGRISLDNSLTYAIGGLGIILVVGGIVYYWQAGRRSSRRSRRRTHAHADGQEDLTGVYCPQCGARAKAGDRFCRVCGARLRQKVD